MGLQSLQYCAFLVVVAAVYLHLPVRMQPVFLLGASWVFYALAMPAMLPVTIALAVFTYLCGRGLAWRGGAHKTAFLRLGVIGMLGILAFFKYNGLLGGVLHGWRAVAMPLGISFTSFAAIAYLIDATRGDCEVETSFIRLALFLNFFATVTQGPICRAGALLPQLSAEHRFDAARTVRALRLYALGLFKYIAVADVLNMVVDTVFPHYADYSAPMLILTAVMYTFYLYFSFSGYSEISRATGLVLGLDLPENFKTPFYATNFSGFWSRWHISFSSWLQDYLFMPLAWADLGRFGRLPTELRVLRVLCFRLLARQHRAIHHLGSAAGGLPRGRRAAAPPLWQTQKARHPGPCAVGQAGCGVCFVDHQHGVLPRGVRQPFRHGRKPGRWRCFRLPGPLPDEQLVPRPLCRGAVQHSVYRLLRQYHYGSGLLGVRCAGAGAWHLAGSPAQFCLQKQTG